MAPQRTHNVDYKPLRTDGQEIRLIQLKKAGVQLHACTSSSQLCCELVHTELSNCPEYTALSYAWGTRVQDSALCPGGNWIRINEAVESALRLLHNKDGNVFVWVDQICINQRDLVEKRHQVQQMKEVYSRAKTVISWLGPESDGSKMILPHLRRMGSLIWAGDHERVLMAHLDNKALETIDKAFCSLCERDYWKRLWVMQEFAVAPSLVIACGEETMCDWHLPAVLTFTNKLALNIRSGLIEDKAAETAAREMTSAYENTNRSFMEGIFARRTEFHRYTETVQPLFQILVTNLVLEKDYNYPLTSEPRDRIFSLLPLAGDKHEFATFPDYTVTCSQVYIQAALTMLHQGHIDLLAYCQFPKTSADIPTWVPDWRMKILSPCTGAPWVNSFHASAGTLWRQRISSPEPDTILISGLVIDSVFRTGGVWHPNWQSGLDCSAAMQYLSQVQTFLELSVGRTSDGFEQTARACLSIAACINMGDNLYAGTAVEALDVVMKRLSVASTPMPCTRLDRATENSKQLSELSERSWCEWYMEKLRLLHSRRPFISTKGHSGLVPDNTRDGDLLCIFFGGKVPYVVRPVVGGVDPCYTLVGEAYVYGAMNGEALQSNFNTVSFNLK